MQVIVFNISAEQMFHGENNLPPEWHVDKFGWMGNRFLFLSSAKLPKSAREILVWEFGGINLCINLFLLGFINLQERKISLIISGKTSANFLNFFCLFHRQSIQMFLQIPEKLQGIFGN